MVLTNNIDVEFLMELFVLKSLKPKIVVLENCLYVVVVVWTPKANTRATRPTLFEISQICILSRNKCMTSCFEKTL